MMMAMGLPTLPWRMQQSSGDRGSTTTTTTDCPSTNLTFCLV